MIKSKHDLKTVLEKEKSIYAGVETQSMLLDYLVSAPSVNIWKYVKSLRKTEYYYNNRNKSLWHKLMYLILRRRKNKLGMKLGIEMWENSFDAGLRIFHGNIVVNGKAKIGKNCSLHGDNCIGNNGSTLDAPTIGDNVDIGVGAKIIGGIALADGIKVGAGAVVISSCYEPNSTLVGVPARVVRGSSSKE